MPVKTQGQEPVDSVTGTTGHRQLQVPSTTESQSAFSPDARGFVHTNKSENHRFSKMDEEEKRLGFEIKHT